MAKYHAAKNGMALCGSRGSANGYNVLIVAAAEWNVLNPNNRCSKCCDKIREMKAAKA